MQNHQFGAHFFFQKLILYFFSSVIIQLKHNINNMLQKFIKKN